MKESTNPKSQLTHQKRLELELLHSVLDNNVYPWNPTISTGDDYLSQLEDTAESEAAFEETFDSQWNRVSVLTEQLWANSSESLMTALVQEFGDRMPAQLLSRLANSAQAVAGSGQALIDQVVVSAQTVLKDWETDDLRVMARPLAMAMRGGQEEILAATLQSIPKTDWENLSELERARLSLAIARYAIGELS